MSRLPELRSKHKKIQKLAEYTICLGLVLFCFMIGAISTYLLTVVFNT